MGRVDPTGWVAVGVGIYETQTIEAEGVKGIPLIIEYIGVKGLPVSFGFDSILING
jgi:hypothetical protein